jgi:hypothetical protein
VVRVVSIAAIVAGTLAVFDLSLVASVVVAVVALLLFVVLPWQARNRFRIRMLKLRQSVRRDIREGRLAKQRLPWRMFGISDGALNDVRDITMLQVVIFKMLAPRQEREAWTQAVESEWKIGIRKLKKGASRDRMRGYNQRWKNLVVVHLFSGTPFGLLFAGIAALYVGLVLAWRLITRPSMRLAKQAVRDRLRGTRESLAMIVRYGVQPKKSAKEKPQRAVAGTS